MLKDTTGNEVKKPNWATDYTAMGCQGKPTSKKPLPPEPPTKQAPPLPTGTILHATSTTEAPPPVPPPTRLGNSQRGKPQGHQPISPPQPPQQPTPSEVKSPFEETEQMNLTIRGLIHMAEQLTERIPIAENEQHRRQDQRGSPKSQGLHIQPLPAPNKRTHRLTEDTPMHNLLPQGRPAHTRSYY